ncbi:FMN-binding protein [Candidatus Saccharibacteria bacterium]|nr:MAG: FMN-binding protein [Candidatus Saccharibacteria bacterium]
MAQNKSAIIGVIAIVLLATAGTAAMVALSKKSDTSAEPATTSQATSTKTTGSSTSAATTSATYKDGTYTATGKYNSPGGNEKIGVTVTLKDGVITAASLDTSDASGDAAEYQDQFASGYKSLVVGKKIDSVSLSRVSGSSLTSNGFNNALDTIKEQAKA